MKIRTGFVSNSSSSSFIITFEKRPKNKEELRKILFGNRKEFHTHDVNITYKVDDILDIIWKDVCVARRLSNYKSVSNIIYWGFPQPDSRDQQLLEIRGIPDLAERPNPPDGIYDLKGNAYLLEQKKFKKVILEWSMKLAKELIFEDYLSKYFTVVLNFGNEINSISGDIEYSNIFDNCMNCLVVSNH